MSSVSKGNKAELEARNTLEAQGWKVFRQHRKPLFMKGKMITIGADIFGSDLVCKGTLCKTKWVQVSTAENLSAKRKQMLEHPINLEHETYEIWIRLDGKKAFEIHRLTQDIGGNYAFQKLPHLEQIQERPNGNKVKA